MSDQLTKRGKEQKDPLFLTPGEVALMLRCSEETVRKRVKRGDLPGHQVGASFLIPRVEFLEKFGLPQDTAIPKERESE